MAPNGMWTTGTTRKSDCHAAAMAAVGESAAVALDAAALPPDAVPVSVSVSVSACAGAGAGAGAGSAQSRSISAPRLPAKTSARAAISVLCRSSAARKTSARLAAYSSSAHGAEVSRHSISAASSVSA
jgi:hypothetical protein